ncbi:unnamed protein product [Haemonchus placei]|uniref:RFX2 n=1 Tax=Haemonchus placei TaxID=6290 RepID=A0A0N4W2A4_HAEPC|nr:unnamed protein product [Haemonchus placei]
MVLPVGAPNPLISQRPVTLRPRPVPVPQGERVAGTAALPVLPAPLIVQHVAQNQHVEVQLGLAPTGGGGFFASVRACQLTFLCSSGLFSSFSQFFGSTAVDFYYQTIQLLM